MLDEAIKKMRKESIIPSIEDDDGREHDHNCQIEDGDAEVSASDFLGVESDLADESDDDDGDVAGAANLSELPNITKERVSTNPSQYNHKYGGVFAITFRKAPTPTASPAFRPDSLH